MSQHLQEDYVELDGVRIDKPFVEKPASGEDPNIHIYYPHSMVSATQQTHRLPTGCVCNTAW
jgi:inositol hexakisphosphate/diphosphoinositol-pentakisphosphate kinase